MQDPLSDDIFNEYSKFQNDQHDNFETEANEGVDTLENTTETSTKDPNTSNQQNESSEASTESELIETTEPTEPAEPTFLKGLNEAQKEAVLCTEGPLLILAGAGAGKTKTLTHRILHLLYKGVDPEAILAITFTNKAAREMRDRLIRLIESDRQLNFPVAQNRFPFVSTFHSLGVYILRKHGEFAGISKNFTIYDRSDSKSAVKEALVALGYDPKQYDPGKILSAISKAKGDALTVQEFKNQRPDFYGSVIGEAWEKYETALKKDKALDFDDLLQKTVLLLETNAEVKNYYQRKFKYVHIDEYQDTNTVQYKLAEMFCEGHQNIAVVGDIDQAIYGWRGAKISNMLRFEKDFRDSKLILLEENYRSTKTILGVANAIIAKNIYRKEKNLFTSNEQGEKISLYVAMDETDEGSFIGTKIQELIRKGADANEIAILYRANFQSRALEDACLYRNIPYHVLGTKFYDRKEVKDLLSYIKLALNSDSGADLKRVINTPTRGIGKTTVLKVLEGKKQELPDSFKIKVNNFFTIISDIRANAFHHPPSETVKYALSRSGLEADLKLEDDEERIENARELVTLAKRYDDLWHEENQKGRELVEGSVDENGDVAGSGNPGGALVGDNGENIAPVKNNFFPEIDPSKYIKQNKSGNEVSGARPNINRFGNDEDEDPSTMEKNMLRPLEKFIEDSSLLGEQDTIDDKQQAGPRVKLMTVHASKGLEFDHVFITGLEKDLFPHSKMGDKEKIPSPEDSEEERRLFYVALTRARKRLFLTYTLIRTIFGSKVFNHVSEFVEDIDPAFIDTEVSEHGSNSGGLLGRLIEF